MNTMSRKEIMEMYRKQISEGKILLGVGAGTFRNESALAVGYSRASDNGKLLFKVGGTASSRGDFGAGAGVGIRWR